MRGNTLTEFMDDLLTMGGPEKEFLFRGKRYFMEAQPYEEDPEQTEFVIFACFGDEENLFRCHGKIMRNASDSSKRRGYLMDLQFMRRSLK